MKERWQVSGDSADYYERYVSLLMEPWVRGVIELAELQPNDRVLDVGCGPGLVARRAAQNVSNSGRVVGIDLNESMLNKARHISTSETGVSIEWREGDAQSLPFDDESFDVVLVQQVLQFCPDPMIALQEMRRVMAAGGRLALSIWRPVHDNPYTVAQLIAFERHVGVEATSSLRSSYSMGDVEELKKLIISAGFHEVNVRPTILPTPVGPAVEFLYGHFAALPFANAIASLDDDAREAMVDDLISGLSEYIVDGVLEFPSGSHLVTARA